MFYIMLKVFYMALKDALYDAYDALYETLKDASFFSNSVDLCRKCI